MKILLALAISIVLVTPCLARLGETMAELKERYGQPIDVEGELQSPTSRWQFTDRRYAIIVTLRKNRSVSEEITRRDQRDFTLREVTELLNDNAAPGADWRQVSARQWRQGEHVATWVERTLILQGEATGE